MNKKQLKEKYKSFDDTDLQLELMNACASGDISIIKYIVNIPQFKENNIKHIFNTLLCTASYNNHLHIVKYLTKNGFLENDLALLTYLNGALEHACRGGSLEIVRYFLHSPEIKYHANINHFDSRCLISACENGHLDVVKYLLTSDELIIHANITVGKNDPLDWACISGHFEVVKYLLSFPEINQDKDFNKILNKSLEYSISANHINIVKYLCQYKEIDLSYNNYEGFRTACDKAHFEIIEYLIFDFKMEKTEDIKIFFKQFSNKVIENMFDARDLKDSLNSDLKTNNNVMKRTKL